MAPLRVQVAAFAAMVAVQLNISGSFASNEAANRTAADNDKPLSTSPFPSLFGGSALGDLDKMLQSSFSSFFGGFGALEGMFRSESSPLSLSLVEGDNDSCQIRIRGGSEGGLAKGVKVGIDTARHVLQASFHHEERQRSEDGEQRRSFLSQAVHVSTSLALPERCIGSAGALMLGYGGYMVSSDGSNGLVILPSSVSLEQAAERGEMPKGVAEAIARGDQQAVGELSDMQQCLAAGFTTDQCLKLGGKKPGVALVDSAEGGQIPVPRLDVSLDVLN